MEEMPDNIPLAPSDIFDAFIKPVITINVMKNDINLLSKILSNNSTPVSSNKKISFVNSKIIIEKIKRYNFKRWFTPPSKSSANPKKEINITTIK